MKRVLLKLSGEALAGDKKMGFDEPTVIKVAQQVKQLSDAGATVLPSNAQATRFANMILKRL